MKRVVIVGRPNVGKSTLFNRLARTRRALTHDLPGMTRDRLSDVITLEDGRRYLLTDTGGLEYGEEMMSDFAEEIRGQAKKAMEEADLILFVVDGVGGIVSEDREIAEDLRPQAMNTILIINKIDTRAAQANIDEFWELGFERVLAISAEHGIDTDAVIESIEAIVPEAGEEDISTDEGPTRLAIIGRPNVGKSSLLNRLAGEERTVVSDISGTTRDAIDTLIERNGRSYLLIDTAGIRRKGKTNDQAEKLAVISARKAIARCQVALLVIDAVEGITAQDAHVAGYAEENGRAAILLVNKWDAIEPTPTLTREFEDKVRMQLKFLSYAPLEFISAKSGRRIEKLFPVIDRVAESFRSRFRTSQLNQILDQAVRRHGPPAVKGKARKFYYATQLKNEPPTIALFSNTEEPLHFSYRRYLENQFREALDLVGTPVHFVLRARKGMKGRKEA
ncbi:MAG: ribosome biogenesis GTPase Der [Acidobacteriota bacterium]